jgi:hypothetical protein
VNVDRQRDGYNIKRSFTLNSSESSDESSEIVYRLYVNDLLKSESASSGSLGEPPAVVEELDTTEQVGSGAASIAVGEEIVLKIGDEHTLWQVCGAGGDVWRATLEVVRK